MAKRTRLRLKEIMDERGITMSGLSRKADVSFKTVKRLYRDPYATANTDTLEKLANALDLSIGMLFEDVNE